MNGNVFGRGWHIGSAGGGSKDQYNSIVQDRMRKCGLEILSICLKTSPVVLRQRVLDNFPAAKPGQQEKKPLSSSKLSNRHRKA